MAQLERIKTPAPMRAGAPILGVLPQVWKDPLAFFLQAGIQNPHVVQLNLGPARFHLVSHPDGVKYILQDNNKNYAKGYERAKPVLGDGLVSSEGELWRRQRRLMQPAFNRQRLGELHPMMVDATREMLAQWQTRLSADTPFDLAREMMLITQTIIVRTMFSTDVGERGNEIGDAFAATLEYLNFGLFAPFPFMHALPIPVKRRFDRAMRVIDEAVYGMIRERRETGVKRQDLLQMLIDARDEETGEGMSDKQMHDEVLTIFLAGHETTATLLSWTFHLLSQHPEAEERLRAEVESVLGRREPDPESVQALAYTGQVLHEALRLYPPAWMFARRAIEDDEVGGYHVPAGATMMLSPYVTHRLPQIWDNPEQFDPGRFSEGEAAPADAHAAAKRPRYAFFPFGGGPRLCIGNNFALMEAPTILAMVMQAYRLRPAPGYTVKVTPHATLRPKPGVFILAQPTS